MENETKISQPEKTIGELDAKLLLLKMIETFAATTVDISGTEYFYTSGKEILEDAFRFLRSDRTQNTDVNDSSERMFQKDEFYQLYDELNGERWKLSTGLRINTRPESMLRKYRENRDRQLFEEPAPFF